MSDLAEMLTITPCRNIKRFRQMRQYQKILTRFQLVLLQWLSMRFFFHFQVNLRNQEIVYQHNITEKYYKIGRSKLH